MCYQREFGYLFALLFFFGIIGFLIDFGPEIFFDYIEFNEKGELWGFIDGVVTILDELSELNAQKSWISTTNAEIAELNQKALELFTEYKPYFAEIKMLIPYLEDNPRLKTKFTEFTENMKLTREK